MLVVEICGNPASGKTTIQKRLTAVLERRNISWGKIFSSDMDDAPNAHAPRFVAARADRALLFNHIRFVRQNPVFSELVDSAFGPDPTQHFLTCLLAAHYQGSIEKAAAPEVLLMDEGFANRIAALAALDKKPDWFDNIIATAPLPDILLHLEPTPEVAFERGVGRRNDVPWFERKFGDLGVFRARSQFLHKAEIAFEKRGARVMQIDSRRPLKDIKFEVSSLVISALRSKLAA